MASLVYCSLCSSTNVVLSEGPGRTTDYDGHLDLPVPEELVYSVCLDCNVELFNTKEIIAYNTAMDAVVERLLKP